MNDTIRNQIASLDTLRLPELQARYAELLGEATRCPNKAFLIRRITEALTARANSAVPEETTSEDAAQIETSPAEPAPAETGNEDAAPEESAGAAPNTAAGEDGPAAETTDGAHSSAEETRLSKLSVPELQALYLEVVGRPTGSSHKRYLAWKVTQARKGRIPVGPRGGHRADGEAADFKVLPLRMEADLVNRLDEARERLGLKSRMELFRRALHAFLGGQGEAEVAALFAPEA